MGTRPQPAADARRPDARQEETHTPTCEHPSYSPSIPQGLLCTLSWRVAPEPRPGATRRRFLPVGGKGGSVAHFGSVSEEDQIAAVVRRISRSLGNSVARDQVEGQ